MDDETNLICQTATGDSRAFAGIVRRYEKTLLSFVSSRVPSSEVEDIVQVTFVKAFVNLKQLRNPERFKPWLFAICRSMIASRTGELKTSREIPLDEISLRAPEEEEIRLSFTLPPGHRELNLRYKCGFSYREIAALKGISETLVKSRIHESRKKLKKTREPSQLTLEEKIMEKTEFYEKGARIIASLSLPHQLKLIGQARDNGKYDEELLKAFASLPGGEDFVLDSEGKLSLSEAAGMICLLPPETSSRIIENIVEEGTKNNLEKEMTLKSIGFSHTDSLQITAKMKGKSLEVSLSGYIDNYNVRQFKEALGRASDFSNIILNCRNLNYISSMGISAFIEIIRDLDERGGSLTLFSLSESIWDVFVLLGISPFVTRIDSIEDALPPNDDQDKKWFLEQDRQAKPLWPTGKGGSEKLTLYGSLTPKGDRPVSGFDYLEADMGLWAIIKFDTAGKEPRALAACAQISALFRQYFSRPPFETEEFCYLINDSLIQLELENSFAALQVLLINEQNGECRICGSGDREVPYFDRSGKAMTHLFLPETPAAGLFPGRHIRQKAPFTERVHQFHHGDTLYLYTDGLNESQRKTSRGYESFGEERIFSLLNREHTLGATQEEIVEALMREERLFRKGEEAADDIVLLSVAFR